jgi:branched-chain amino acid transport system permease protein
MNEFLRSLAGGLGQGAVYALLALGFVIIYKATRVINLAIPAFMVAGAVFVSYLVGPLGFFLALGVGVVAVSVLALGVERSVIRPMIGRPVFVVAIITLGVDIALRVVLNGFIGVDVRRVGDPWGFTRTTLLGISVQERHIAMFVTTVIVVAALFAFFKYSRFGLAMRATAFDQETALTQGVSVSTVFATSWAIGGGLSALAGVLLPPAASRSASSNRW